MIAARVVERDESPHLAFGGIICGATVHAVAETLQCGRCLLPAVLVFDFKPDGVIRRIAFHVAKRMRTVVRSQIERLLAPLGDLQPETARRKSLRRFHIRSSQANIADVFQIDHCFFSRLPGLTHPALSSGTSLASLPHSQSDSAASGNWRAGRRTVPISLIPLTYEKMMPSGPST